MSCDKLNSWSIITILCPNHYSNHSLYLVGHLYGDNIFQDIEKVLPLVTEMLTASFSQHGSAKKLVVINPLQEVDTPMEIEVVKSDLNQLAIIGVKSIDDTDKGMSSDVLNNLQLHSRGAKDHLHKDDAHQYEGDEKLNSKSFNSGSSVGYIDLNTATDEVLFAQIRMVKELMFNVIPLIRYNHLVGNGGLKVCTKRTALTSVPWKSKMACTMTLPGKLGCYCLIKIWSSKEMFIEHWQIYHIDQHNSCILCEHRKDGISYSK